jgi:auxin-responsive protein IAA
VAAAAMAADLGFEETELRLGLPGGGGGGGGDGEGARSASGKRGFAETIDLKLKLEPAAAAVVEEEKEVVDAAKDAAAAEESPAGKMKRSPSQSSVITAAAAAQPDPAEKPRAPKYVVVPTHSLLQLPSSLQLLVDLRTCMLSFSCSPCRDVELELSKKFNPS